MFFLSFLRVFGKEGRNNYIDCFVFLHNFRSAVQTLKCSMLHNQLRELRPGPGFFRACRTRGRNPSNQKLIEASFSCQSVSMANFKLQYEGTGSQSQNVGQNVFKLHSNRDSKLILQPYNSKCICRLRAEITI